MIWILDIGVRMYLNKLILIFLILTILLLLIYCEKIVEPTIKEIFIDLKSMITKRDEFLKRVLQICEKLGKIYGVLYRGKQKI